MKIIFEIPSLNLIVTETKEIWQLPYCRNKRNYPVRKIDIYIHQGHEKIRINQMHVKKTDLYAITKPVNYDYVLPTDEVRPF